MGFVYRMVLKVEAPVNTGTVLRLWFPEHELLEYGRVDSYDPRTNTVGVWVYDAESKKILMKDDIKKSIAN